MKITILGSGLVGGPMARDLAADKEIKVTAEILFPKWKLQEGEADITVMGKPYASPMISSTATTSVRESTPWPGRPATRPRQQPG